ncbi:pyridoxamine 5'-phosphate oxidase family protein [Streptomyces sp. AM 4-1-1]|uniref:pyridoxamine 5'-phosphate oxidase family protein n=1 Tax=Streptomyces sp. AM 4-1-1 TaxID=3028710 RepID=UPI0023B943CB|nr:pyridoxamine 5'-phosphate oxidase family protein [Streptomyces sp. AM 4-1-1]WEH34417.1 pyridoxamine 5'-phosphate oxidase family protein [Streptomyces sp. AM 4-1-1]
MSRYARLAYTPAVRQVQHEMGSGIAAGRRLREPGDLPEPLTSAEAAFVGSLDGFLLASVGETGWPYVQFRGGPPGFVHVLDGGRIGYADVGGNRQYITTGNLRTDDRVALFFIDHARRVRLKMFGHARAVPADDEPELAERLVSTRTEGRVERLVVIEVEGYDWNCPRHITPRFSERELTDVLAPVRERMAGLERENEELRAQVAAMRQREREEAAGPGREHA